MAREYDCGRNSKHDEGQRSSAAMRMRKAQMKTRQMVVVVVVIMMMMMMMMMMERSNHAEYNFAM